MSSRRKVAREFNVGEVLLRSLEKRGVIPTFGSLCPSGYRAAVRLYLGSRLAGTSAHRLTTAMRKIESGEHVA